MLRLSTAVLRAFVGRILGDTNVVEHVLESVVRIGSVRARHRHTLSAVTSAGHAEHVDLYLLGSCTPYVTL